MQSVQTYLAGFRARNGLTLIELTIAVAVLSVLMATSIQMISAASKQMRANDRRRIALQTAQAVSEQIGNVPWDKLSAEGASRMPLPESAAAHLPGAELKVAVNDETDPVAKRITVEIIWTGSGADRAGPVRLTSWVFPEIGHEAP